MGSGVAQKLNISLILGLLFGSGIILFAFLDSSNTLWVFVNLIGIVIVVGGLFAAGFIMFPAHENWELIKTLMSTFYSAGSQPSEIVHQIVKIAQAQQQDQGAFARAVGEVKDFQLKDALELLSMGFKADDLQKYLAMRQETAEMGSTVHAGYLLTLSKLCPAFGLIGTIVGLVVLLFNMGQGGGLEQIGPAMAISLCATLYGVLIANVYLVPWAEYITYRSHQREHIGKIISDGILLLKEKRHPIHIRETLKSYLGKKDLQRLNQLASEQVQARVAEEQGAA